VYSPDRHRSVWALFAVPQRARRDRAHFLLLPRMSMGRLTAT
jgi:hypothetical protein